MIKTLEIDGKEMTAVILENVWQEEIGRYRESLLNVIESSLSNEGCLTNGFPSGGEICDCITLVRALEQKPVLEKGGRQ